MLIDAYHTQVFPVHPATSVPPVVRNAPTIARRESSSSVVSLQTPNLVPSAFTLSVSVAETSNIELFVSIAVTLHGDLSMLPERQDLSVL